MCLFNTDSTVTADPTTREKYTVEAKSIFD